MKPIRIGMILPGLGRVQRGAETAFLEVAAGLAEFPDVSIELFGSGEDVPEPLTIQTVRCKPRERFERWPKFPVFRSECHYEEFSFVRNLKRSGKFQPNDFDAVIHCTYPFVNWFLKSAKRKNPNLSSIFVTQNGDWMCRAGHREYKYFQCDGLVTINPDYYEQNKNLHNTCLIPNGTDPEIFYPRDDARTDAFPVDLDLPSDKTIVLMVSAMIESKRVDVGLRATAQVEDAFFLVAGDGPEREKLSKMAEELSPGRHKFLGSIPREQMPALFRHSDVFLHMSQIEPFGIVYLEAAASGLPVVTHDGKTPRWILGDTALFADSNQIELVAAAIRKAMDEQTRSELAGRARERVIQDWTWKAQAAKYRQFIRSIKGMDSGDDSQNEQENHDALDHHRQLQHV